MYPLGLVRVSGAPWEGLVSTAQHRVQTLRVHRAPPVPPTFRVVSEFRSCAGGTVPVPTRHRPWLPRTPEGTVPSDSLFYPVGGHPSVGPNLVSAQDRAYGARSDGSPGASETWLWSIRDGPRSGRSSWSPAGWTWTSLYCRVRSGVSETG